MLRVPTGLSENLRGHARAANALRNAIDQPLSVVFEEAPENYALAIRCRDQLRALERQLDDTARGLREAADNIDAFARDQLAKRQGQPRPMHYRRSPPDEASTDRDDS